MPTLILTRSTAKQYDFDDDIYIGSWANLNPLNGNKGATLPYHWADKSKKVKDAKYLHDKAHKILDQLFPIMNRLHNTQYSKKYWDRLLANWLNRFLIILFDRYSMINEAANLDEINRVVIVDKSVQELIALDIPQFNQLAEENDYWNLCIYSEIIKKYTKMNYTVTTLDDEFSKTYNFINREKNQNFNFLFNKIQNFLFSNKKYFFVNTYFSYRLKLDLLFNSAILNKKLKNVFIEPRPIDKRMRGALKLDLTNIPFNDLIKTFLPKMIPVSFIEGYKSLNVLSKRMGLSSKSSIILTSNFHWQCHPFMHWVAKSCETGSKFYISEHGSHSISKVNATYSMDYIIADKIIHRGDQKKKLMISAIGDYINYKKKLKPKNNGCISIISVAFPRYASDLRSMAISSLTIDYILDLTELIKKIPNQNNEQIQLRLYHEDYDWKLRQNIKNLNLNIEIVDQNKTYIQTLKESKLIIITYEGSTLIDSIRLDFPSLIYFDDNIWELSDLASPIFDELQQVGIFHKSHDSIVKQLNEIDGSINQWWNSAKVEAAKKLFCNYFASKNFRINNLAKLN